MSFFRTMKSAIIVATIALALAFLISLIFVLPASMGIASLLGVDIATANFVPICFLVLEAGIFLVFAYTLWIECGFPDVEKSNPWHLVLYPVLPFLLLAGYDHGSIPIELLGGVSALCLVGSLYQALIAREKAQLFFGSRFHHPLFKQRVFRSTIVVTGLILLGGLCFVHLQEGIGWLVTRIVLWMMTAVYVLAGFLYRDVWYQEFRSENEADPR